MNIRHWFTEAPHRLSLLVVMISLILLFSQAFQSQAGDGDSLLYLPFVQKCIAPAAPLLNAGFEEGAAWWVFDPYGLSSVVNSAVGITPHTGNWMAYLEPPIYMVYPSIEQTFTVPDCLPYLAFWWSAKTSCGIVSGDRCGSYFKITVNGSPFKSFSGPIDQPWKKEVVDLRLYEGTTILLRFISDNAYDYANIVIDDITFQNSPSP